MLTVYFGLLFEEVFPHLIKVMSEVSKNKTS